MAVRWGILSTARINRPVIAASHASPTIDALYRSAGTGSAVSL